MTVSSPETKTPASGSPPDSGRPSNFIERALPLARLGYYITPLAPRGKAPILTNWPNTASRDETQIHQWASQFPRANVGIVQSSVFPDGTWGFDADDPVWTNDPNGGLHVLDLAHGKFEGSTPEDHRSVAMVRTSPGKFHLHFKHDEYSRAHLGNYKKPNPSERTAYLFEIKYDATELVGPGSVHPDTGGIYEWSSEVREPKVAPHALIDWIVSQTPKRSKITVSRRASKLTDVAESGGGRNQHLAVIAGWLTKHFDFNPESMKKALLICTKKFHAHLAKGVLSEKEISQTVAAEKPWPSEHTGLLKPQVVKLVKDALEFTDTEAAEFLLIYSEQYDKTPLSIEEGAKIVSTAGTGLPKPQLPPHVDKPRFILPPRNNDSSNYGRWFARKTVSLIAGASGSGKTKIVVHIAEDLRLGKPVLKHPKVTAEYGFVLVDRDKLQMGDTLENLGLNASAVLDRCVEIDLMDRTAPDVQVANILQRWEESGSLPDVVFLEGADLWCKPSDPDSVIHFLGSLRKVAHDWNIAIIATVGSPKMKPKEQYALTRDKIYGCIFWGRVSETVLLISLTDPNDSNSCRRIEALPRNGASEQYFFCFKDGRLEFTDKPESGEAEKAEEPQKKKGRPKSALLDVVGVIRESKPGTVLTDDSFPWLSRATVFRTLRELAHPSNSLVVKKKDQWVVAEGAHSRPIDADPLCQVIGVSTR